jgi:hypothetical protein
MTRTHFALVAVALIAAVPCAARSAPAMSPAMLGVGAHGYDSLIGTWSCKNSVPSPMGGPAVTTLVIGRAVNGALSVHVAGANFDAMGYVVYAPKAKTWSNPSTESHGGYGTESTQQTGKKTTWEGPFVDPSSGKTMQVRDTYTFSNLTTYTDLYQVEVGGTWKTEGNTVCTKA